MKDVEKMKLVALRHIIDTRQPRGLFIARESRRLWVGVDNSHGDAWTEAFRSRRQCLRWLRDPSLNAEDFGAKK